MATGTPNPDKVKPKNFFQNLYDWLLQPNTRAEIARITAELKRNQDVLDGKFSPEVEKIWKIIFLKNIKIAVPEKIEKDGSGEISPESKLSKYINEEELKAIIDLEYTLAPRENPSLEVVKGFYETILENITKLLDMTLEEFNAYMDESIVDLQSGTN